MCRFIRYLTVFFVLITLSAVSADARLFGKKKQPKKPKTDVEVIYNYEDKSKVKFNIIEDKKINDNNGADLDVPNDILSQYADLYRLPQEVYSIPKGEIYLQSTAYISFIDPKIGDKGINTYYPGFRSDNQLIIYTPDFGMRTGTNEFGAEVAVVKNTVVKFTGSDSLIPREGFIISGHGKAKKWILDNIKLGSKIYINPETMQVTAFVTSDTSVFEANEKIKETANVIEYYKLRDKCYDYKKSLSLLTKAKDNLKKAEKNPDKAEQYVEQSKEYVSAALNNALPYKENELKGVWIRPVEHSEREIVKTVEDLKASGINNVFLETFYHGTTIYPSNVLEKYGVVSQRGEFKGIDPLAIWIKECHKRDIKVHVWFQTFYIGNQPPRSSMKHILVVHPEWANTTKALAESTEIACSKAEHDGYFIDPANPEVQKFVLELLNEVITKYRPDGINLDYIRYPLGTVLKTDNSTGTEWGYTKFARNEFSSKYGVDPLTVKVADPLKNKWYEYRQQKITDFLSDVRRCTLKNKVMLTAVIFTDKDKALMSKMQDWHTWNRRNLVDGYTPLIFSTDRKTAHSIIHSMKTQIGSHAKLYPGIFVMYMNAPVDQLMLQIHETRAAKSDGLIFFDYAHFTAPYKEAVGIRVFNNKKK
ncbi:MAG: family 10 glycosylhydrolase [Candidatus Gastranaerophilales bacterium]|nr:family 10 glycosylhydrolase [Candidatus Gastranaerophilales bacterium]